MVSNLKKKRLVRFYEIMLPILALISLFTLMSLGSNFFKYSLQPKLIFLLNHLIWIIFASDLFVRMHLTDNKKHFLTRHLAELVAILPVYPFILLAVWCEHPVHLLCIVVNGELGDGTGGSIGFESDTLGKAVAETQCHQA